MTFSFQTRLTLFFSVLFAAAQLVTFAAVYHVIEHNASEQVNQQLRYVRQAFDVQMHEREQARVAAAKILAHDFGFRSAVTSRDVPTIHSALRNLGQRMSAKRAMFISLQYEVLADTQRGEADVYIFPDPLLLIEAELSGSALAVMNLDSVTYQLIAVPVMAPDIIGWIGIGVSIDQALTDEFVAGLPGAIELSLVLKKPGSSSVVLGSTLTGATRAEFDSTWENKASNRLPHRGMLAGREYVMLTSPISTEVDNANVFVVMQYPLDEALSGYKAVEFALIVVVAAGFALVLVGATGISRSLAKPIRALTEAAGRIRAGRYGIPVNTKQSDEMGQLAAAFNHMADGIAQREAIIKLQAYTDSLTGMPNRLCLEEQLKDLLSSENISSTKFAICLVSVDRFGEINSTLGHYIGDALIQSIGAHLTHSFKELDTVARLSSDTFALFLPGIVQDTTTAIAGRILGLFSKPLHIQGNTIDASVHIGIALFPEHGKDPASLLRMADLAVYAARHDPQRFVIYDARADSTSQARLSLMGELREAIAQDELVLYYQPQVDMLSNRVSRVEALVRWKHPVHGFMSPDDFVPLAEYTGNIYALTEWVLDHAVRQVAYWARSGIDLELSVNLSVKDLLHRDFPILVAGAIHRENFPGERLCLEITEGQVMRSPERVISVLNALDKMNMTLAIDDFGTGHSSLAYLKRLPVSELKIDKSFVLGMTENRQDAAIVSSTIELGHSLSMRVVAEGVENSAALDMLRQGGCDFVQGYHIARPMPAQAFEDWFRSSEWGRRSYDGPQLIERQDR